MAAKDSGPEEIQGSQILNAFKVQRKSCGRKRN